MISSVYSISLNNIKQRKKKWVLTIFNCACMPKSYEKCRLTEKDDSVSPQV